MAEMSTSPYHAYVSAEYGKARQLPEREKARMWDELAVAIQRPGLRDLTVLKVSGMLRAVNLLLAYREELPPALAAELDAWKVALDAMHLESIEGWADADGVLNLLPTHMVISLMGAIREEHEHDA
jgi:hypothetical protein